MSHRLIITPLANHDIDEACQWYGEHDPDLGLRFVREVRRRFESILRHPELALPVGRKGIRKVRLLKWPHSIYYRLHHDQIHVLAIWHGARDPKQLNYRLR